MNHYAIALKPPGGVCVIESDYYDIRDGFVSFYRDGFGYSELIASHAVGCVDFVALQEVQDDFYSLSKKGGSNE